MPSPDKPTTDMGDFDADVDGYLEKLSLLFEVMAARKQLNLKAHREYRRVAEVMIEALDEVGSKGCPRCACAREFAQTIMEVSDGYVRSLTSDE
jgi:hypothetical protein